MFDGTTEVLIVADRIYMMQAPKIISTMSAVLLSRILWGPMIDDTTEILIVADWIYMMKAPKIKLTMSAVSLYRIPWY